MSAVACYQVLQIGGVQRAPMSSSLAMNGRVSRALQHLVVVCMERKETMQAAAEPASVSCATEDARAERTGCAAMHRRAEEASAGFASRCMVSSARACR
jgi:hypothetical protein